MKLYDSSHILLLSDVIHVNYVISGPASVSDVHKMTDFMAGDDRAMSQPTLLSMHVVWFREHNRIAKYLKYYLKSKGEQSLDDILFQVMIFLFRHL